ncbi:hypothetical protein [Desulfoscipio gibsoniae]|uniref:Uncharacterized protein n=1 Tax=Desulfoscipio gibsoniae DSM 7213 TaxID=767817 RepID=R4KE51_9FIRM|nr:hypothetical protein [Desulfoscipio gibsoniae]AGL01448.1 hypothetical protein Desgi_2006 [Desulfoscipio gibsoniae DSM 7213]
MEKNKHKSSKETGDAFVEEPTGSATMVNLDGQWDHDFTDRFSNNKTAGK